MGTETFVEFGGLAEGFGKRGVRVDGAGEIGDGRAGFKGQGGLGNQIARAGTGDGDAQQFSGTGVGEDFRDAIGAVEGKARVRWPPRGIWKLGALVLVPWPAFR